MGGYDYAPAEPIIRRWDGKKWHGVPQERVEGGLYDVAAISDSDAWAVGGFGTPLAMHWDGAAWTQVPTPKPGSSAGLDDVVAISSNDVWAVGHYVDQTRGHGLAMHWDGSKWTVYPDAPSPHGIYFHAVSAASSDDVWAVGYKTISLGEYQPVIEHWDGAKWSAVPSTDPPGNNNILFDVLALSVDDAWAVGEYGSPPGSPLQPLVEHWDGSGWLSMDVPVSPGDHNWLSAISAVSPGDLWAVGSSTDLDLNKTRPLAEHWDGSIWTRIEAGSPSDTSGNLFAASAISASDIWVVGLYFNEDLGNITPLTEHSRGVCPPG